MSSLSDILKPLVIAEHFCEEQNCSLCMSAIKTAQELVVKNFTPTNIQSDAIALCKRIACADFENINVTEASAWVREAKRLLAQQHT